MACFVVGAAPHRMFTHACSTPPTAAQRPELFEASDFDCIGDLGYGGFAKVTKVRHRRTGEVFALKEAFNTTRDTEEEAEVLRRATRYQSPYVVRCHAVIVGPDGGPASVLEYMDAGCLLTVLRRRGWRGFPEPALAEVASCWLMGLAQLHSRGVAHLDVKPENFLTNAKGEVKINDFNPSRVVYGRAGENLLVSTSSGTPAYFSPERFEPNAHAEPRGAMAADVWGLGLTILELFLGHQPIVPDTEDPTTDDWMEVIYDREPPSVPEYMEASADLRAFVEACLQMHPAQRARVPQLLKHPFIINRDVAASSRVLRELIVDTL